MKITGKFIFSCLLFLVLGQLGVGSATAQKEEVVVGTGGELPIYPEKEVPPALPPAPVLGLESELSSSTLTPAVGEPLTLTLTISNSSEVDVPAVGSAFELPVGITPLTEGLTQNPETGWWETTPVTLTVASQTSVEIVVKANEEAWVNSVVRSMVSAEIVPEISFQEIQLEVSGGVVPPAVRSAEAGDAKGAWVPNFTLPTVNTASGGVGYSQPIAVPPGRGGLQPSVSLNYSSRSVDGVLGWVASDWVGLGWNIDNIDIVRADVKFFSGNLIGYSNRFQLILNGASYNLEKENPATNYGRYYAENGPDLYIERLNAAGGNGSGSNKTSEYFIVRTADGTTYRLGYTFESEQVVYPSVYTVGGSDPYAGNASSYTTYRFRVDQVTDVHGNQMVFKYQEYPTSDGTRDLASYPLSIKYNYNGSTYLAELFFKATEVNDTDVHSSDLRMFITRQKLLSVQVKWGGNITKEYVLGYNERYTASTAIVLTLESIREYGYGGFNGGAGYALPATEFDYTAYNNKEKCQYGWLQCDGNTPSHIREYNMEGFAYERLTEMRNGYGGRVTFAYQHDNRHSYMTGYYTYRVTEKRVYANYYEGSTALPDSIETYLYGIPCYSQTGNFWPATGSATNCPFAYADTIGSLAGHDSVQVTIKDGNGQSLQKINHFYHTNGVSQTGFVAHYNRLLTGKEYRTEKWDGTGTKMLEKVISNYDHSSELPENTVCQRHSNLILMSCLASQMVYRHVPYNYTSYIDSMFYVVSDTRYSYDMNYQGNMQLGLTTHVYQYVDGAIKNTTRTWYSLNTSAWIVNRPIQTMTYKGNADQILSGQWLYYDGATLTANNTFGTAPTKGLVTRSRTLTLPLIPACASNCSYDTLDVMAKYNSQGNLTHSYQATKGWLTPSSSSGASWGTLGSQITYDSAGLFPTQTSDALGQTTGMEYNLKLPWLPKKTIQMDNTQQWLEYDPFGRLFAVYDTMANRGTHNDTTNPDAWDSTMLDGDPVVRYGYWDNTWNYATVTFLPSNDTPNGPFMVSTIQRPLTYPYPNNSSQFAYNDQVFYDGLGRVIQTRKIWTDAAENESRENETFTLTGYDALGRVVCQSVPVRANYFMTRAPWPANPVFNSSCAAEDHSSTSYDLFGQVVETTPPNGEFGSQMVYGERFTLGYDAEHRVTQQFSNKLGLLVAVDELKEGFVDQFTSGANLATNWPVSAVGGSTGSRMIVADQMITNALEIHHQTGGTSYGVGRNLAVGSTSSEGATFDLKVSSSSAVTYAYLDRGSSSTYEMWGVLVEGGQIKLVRKTGTGSEVKTNLMPAQAGVWYRVAIRTNYDNLELGEEDPTANDYVLAVWEVGNPSNQVVIRQAVAREATDWKFVAKTHTVGHKFYLGNFVEREIYQTDYAYDLKNQLTMVINANTQTTTMSYNGFGQKTGMSDPDMGQWAYAYDANGNLTQQTDAKGEKLCFYYDSLNRLTFKAQMTPATTDCVAQNLLIYTAHTGLASYTYGTSGSSKGKLVSTSWYRDGQSDSETLSYDSLGRLTTHTRVINGRSYTQQILSFDMFNRPVQVKYTAPSNSSGTTVTIGYDLEGEDNFMEGGTQLLSAVDYNVMGQMLKVNRTNSAVKDTTYSYYNVTGNFQLKTIEHGIQNDSLPNYEYVYLDNGNISQITEHVYGTMLKSQTQTFSYDFLNRLKTASAPLVDSGLGLTAYNQTFGYDKLGNITSINHNGTVTNYSYGTSRPHAVSSTSGGMASSYVYDNNGNMTSRTQSGVGYTQSFDGENRLASVTSGGQTTQFKYDQNGQRTMTIAADGSKTFYPFPHMEETTAAADPLDTTLKMTYLVAGQPLAIRTITKVDGTTITANTLHYVYTDHLGSASVVTDSSGGNPQVTRFLPFGGYRNTPTQTVTDRGFTGHMHNDEVGLIYMNARFYVPNIGRFASADTIIPNPTNPQSHNRYSYVRNSPLSRIDPSGHADCSMLGDAGDTFACSNPDTRPTIPDGEMIDFTGEWSGEKLDEDGNPILDSEGKPVVYDETWKQKHIQQAAVMLGRLFANILNQMHPGWNLTPKEAFLLVYGGTVVFNHTGINTGYGAFTHDQRNIDVYTTGLAFPVHWAVHELGHAFNHAIGGIGDDAWAANTDPSILRRTGYDEENSFGFAGTHKGFLHWQQSTKGDDAGEEFGDMMIGWAYNSWELNRGASLYSSNWTPAGQARANFMDNNMSYWLNVAITN